jgi:hypothetical protein
LAVGHDGRIRLNGTDLGPLLPEERLAKLKKLKEIGAAPEKPISTSPIDICRGALAAGVPLQWDEGTFSKPFLVEAKARGLSLKNCAELAGREDEKLSFKRLTDYEVCKAATTYKYKGLAQITPFRGYHGQYEKEQTKQSETGSADRIFCGGNDGPMCCGPCRHQPQNRNLLFPSIA